MLPDKSQGPFDNFIEMLAAKGTILALVLLLSKKLSLLAVAQSRRLASEMEESLLSDSFHFLFRPLSPFKISENHKCQVDI